MLKKKQVQTYHWRNQCTAIPVIVNTTVGREIVPAASSPCRMEKPLKEYPRLCALGLQLAA